MVGWISEALHLGLALISLGVSAVALVRSNEAIRSADVKLAEARRLLMQAEARWRGVGSDGPPTFVRRIDAAAGALPSEPDVRRAGSRVFWPRRWGGGG